MEISTRTKILDTSLDDSPSCASSSSVTASSSNNGKQVQQLQLLVEELKARLLDTVHQREEEDLDFQRAMIYASAKGTANAVLHTLFDQASAGKYQVLESYCDSGVIPTRDGLKHWRLDLRTIRNETGTTLLHTSVDASMARQPLKVKLVELLVDRVGFDVNVRDVFGRTPLHVAAMAGLVEVVQALLDRGADASIRDRSGLTALSMVRTLSRPPEEVVQVLATVGSSGPSRVVSTCVPRQKSIVSTLFLQALVRYVQPQYVSLFTQQTNRLLNELTNTTLETIDFDHLLGEHVPLLFEKEAVRYFQRAEELFIKAMYLEEDFIKDLTIEATAYGLSLISAGSTTSTGGPAWVGWLSKLIQVVKTESAELESHKEYHGCGANESVTTQHGTSGQTKANAEDVSSQCSSVSLSRLKSSPSPIHLASTPFPHKRQPWHYAVLMKAASQPFPVSLTVEKGQTLVVCGPTISAVDEVSRLFPLSDRLLIGSSLYHCVEYNEKTRQIRLDREYEGASATSIPVYISGSCSSFYPPYITYKRIWECEPGNKYEDHLSDEQELFQDYQFMDPNSEYEVAVKLGPVRHAHEARALVDEWQAQARQLFYSRTCRSDAACCAYYCPQRLGHSLCLETMVVIGREFAKDRLGRPTYSKPLKARASLQKYQNQFLGQQSPLWPGSPSSALHVDSTSNNMLVDIS